MMGISRRLMLAIALSASTTAASPASLIFARATQKTCAAKNLDSCPDALPENFCCTQGSSCIALAGNTTALCCPDGGDCDFIQIITCDINKQDADKFPKEPIKTNVFNVDLETCGDGCCPFGYACSDNGLCKKDKDQSKKPGASNPTATATTATADPTSATASATGSETATGTAVSTSSPTSTDTPADQSDDSGKGKDSSSPATTSIIGGVVGGCLVLLLIAVVIFLYIRRSNRRHAASLEKNRKPGHMRQNTAGSAVSAPFGNIISEPIMQPNSYRTDFILKTPSVHSVHGADNAPPRPQSNTRGLYPRISIPNPFDSPNPSAHSPTATSRASMASYQDEGPLRQGRIAGARLAPIRAMKASSRHLRRLTGPGSRRERAEREPSSENINVFADPTTVGSPVERDPRHTTFSDLMDEAELGDVRRGRPYVPGTTPRL